MKNNNIGYLRKSYNKKTLNDDLKFSSPFELFQVWFSEALLSNSIEEVNAMSLSTFGEDGYPRTRIVLLKQFSDDGFVFYTNYNSKKGKSIILNPKVGLSFFWPTLERQVIINGIAEKVSSEISDIYFNSRPLESKLGAIISPQSERIPNRKFLENSFSKLKKSKSNLIRPEHWGGFIVKAESFEFWQGRPNRLHDRIQFELESNKWKKYRLAP
tara:strand:- start:29 stop:670 length:642 start_codon:yes stop_codon:yes gene_type:complete